MSHDGKRDSNASMPQLQVGYDRIMVGVVYRIIDPAAYDIPCIADEDIVYPEIKLVLIVSNPQATAAAGVGITHPLIQDTMCIGQRTVIEITTDDQWLIDMPVYYLPDRPGLLGTDRCGSGQLARQREEIVFYPVGTGRFDKTRIGDLILCCQFV